MAQRNYLNNKDLLKQIHLSKQTYCAYTHDKFKDYDLIVAEHVNCIDIEDLTDEHKEEAITNRKKRLQIDKDIEVDVDPNDIVYRVTYLASAPTRLFPGINEGIAGHFNLKKENEQLRQVIERYKAQDLNLEYISN